MDTTGVDGCFLFFFSSRRRHTRLQGDWSSDVCSSDLRAGVLGRPLRRGPGRFLPTIRARQVGPARGAWPDLPCGLEPPGGAGGVRREIGRASCREKSVDLGGRRIIKKKKRKKRG